MPKLIEPTLGASPDAYGRFVSYRPRIEMPGGYYHVSTRGNNRRSIFADDHDRIIFLTMLRRVAAKHAWTLYAYCLMDNHYHLVMQIGAGGMSRGMCELNTAYATSFNARHGRVNHLFGRRYWDVLIESDRQLLETCRYVVLNPCRAGLARSPKHWVWSSYRATVGLALAFPCLAVGGLLEHFGHHPKRAARRFAHYCRERPGGHVRWQPP